MTGFHVGECVSFTGRLDSLVLDISELVVRAVRADDGTVWLYDSGPVLLRRWRSSLDRSDPCHASPRPGLEYALATNCGCHLVHTGTPVVRRQWYIPPHPGVHVCTTSGIYGDAGSPACRRRSLSTSKSQSQIRVTCLYVYDAGRLSPASHISRAGTIWSNLPL